MVKVKKIIMCLVLLISILAIVLNFNRLKDLFLSQVDKNVREVEIKPSNKYTTDYSFSYVKISDDYTPENYNDLINIFYNVLNNGWKEFRFYCDEEYSNCLDDIVKISDDNELLSVINNMVHPYNSYDRIKITYDETGEINVKIIPLYTEDEINKIDKEIDRIIKDNTTYDMSTEEKIKSIHNYIINNTKYDSLKKENKSQYESEKMTGLLFEHYAICSGYSETMAVVLNKLGIKNYRIISANHVWNAVYFNNEWLHLDLTWDDPISKSGQDILSDKYFLVNTDKLFQDKESISDHQYDKNIYKEFK